MSIKKRQKVAVFVDVQNMYYSAKNLYDSKMNYKSLLKEASDKRLLTRALAYVIKANTPDEENFFEALERIGFEVKTKDLKTFYSGEKKGDWDMGIAIDALKICPKVDVVVLVSGDGDFKSLVEHLQAKGVKVDAISFGKSTAKELKESANEFIDMDEDKDRFLID